MIGLTAMTAAAIITPSCGGKTSGAEGIPSKTYITVGADGEFHRGDSVYRFTGTNFCSAPKEKAATGSVCTASLTDFSRPVSTI